MAEQLRFLITGDRGRAPTSFQQGASDFVVEWTPVPVLAFSRISIDGRRWQAIAEAQWDWLLFSSPRAVGFWLEMVAEYGTGNWKSPQVACIGESTAECLREHRIEVDYVPEVPGSEAWLSGFFHRAQAPGSLLHPLAEKGRKLIGETLGGQGWKVEALPVYRTLKRNPIMLSREQLADAHGIVFTSPSSVEFFLQEFDLPLGIKVFSIGEFTQTKLGSLGVSSSVVPNGDISRVGEVYLRGGNE